jgi:hypothetical protein
MGDRPPNSVYAATLAHSVNLKVRGGLGGG